MLPSSRLRLRVFLLLAALSSATLVAQEALAGPDTLQVPDTGWKLWPDTAAAWKQDVLYLPGDFKLASLPVNPPTGGWETLDRAGIPVTLPSTVEQHFWGKLSIDGKDGLRPYSPADYTYATSDSEVKNGNYEGVSWWWRTVDIPASFSHKTVLLHLRGARQRAEVFVNHKLVGYDLIGETAFDVDISAAIIPGHSNQIAIRITSPGGRLDWRDFGLMQWGKYTLPNGLGFGGIDRGITITAHDPIYLADSWVLNSAAPHEIHAFATLRNTTAQPQSGVVRFSVIDLKTGAVRVAKELPATIAPNTEAQQTTTIADPGASLWDLDSPSLYGMRATFTSATAVDTRTVRFGFRSFEPRGIGSSAGLYLNGRRIRLYTAISWGFWGLNGVWPTPELAKKEVTTARQLGLNMLNFHRNIGKEDVLDQQDEIGLLRYMEPGAGSNLLVPPSDRTTPAPNHPIDTSGAGGQADSFLERYQTERTLRMVRMFRSHPSLVMDVVQNETEPDLGKPHVWSILHAMHDLDPSRVIAAKSGISPLHQAWFAPWSSEPRFDDGTGYSGWRDEHTVGGPGLWVDDLYRDPTHFTHHLDDPKEIVDWGEMLGSPSEDHHALMLQQIDAAGGDSYDKLDHQELEAAYRSFTASPVFHAAFPSTTTLYDQIGAKAYQFWGRVIEIARLSDSNDILTISGWESTAIENHSGLVDNLRNPKGDPALLAPHLAPLLPVVRPRGLVHRPGEPVLVDLYLLNETSRPATGNLVLTLTAPDGKTTPLGAWPAPVQSPEHFVFPVQMGLTLPALTQTGRYRLSFSLQGPTLANNSEVVDVVDPMPANLAEMHIGIFGEDTSLSQQLKAIPRLHLDAWQPGQRYDAVIAPQHPHGKVVHFDDGSRIAGTLDEPLYRNSIRGHSNSFSLHLDRLPAGKAEVSLYFADLNESKPGRRVFDIQLNHQTVLKDFDIVSAAGAGNTVVVKSFTVDTVKGAIDIGPGNVRTGEALFNAAKIEVGGKTFTYVFGGENYVDKAGRAWTSFTPPGEELPPALLTEVRAGTPLLVLAPSEASASTAANTLAAAGAFHLTGFIPAARAAWMGSWIILGEHPLLNGLPQNEVMNGDYQVQLRTSYGLMVDGPDVRVIAAYNRDHSRIFGASAFSTRLGQGTILFDGLSDTAGPVQTRLLTNALAWLRTQIPADRQAIAGN